MQNGQAEQAMEEAWQQCEGCPRPLYNLSTLVCLPKQHSREDDAGNPIFKPGVTRPLAIVNNDNRLVAASARRAWEQHILSGGKGETTRISATALTPPTGPGN